jgi:hypothetical protein
MKSFELDDDLWLDNRLALDGHAVKARSDLL